MATGDRPVPQRLVLANVDWKTYSRLLHAFAEQRRIRLTYDRGTLEIMGPSCEKLPVEQGLVLDLVDWETYTRLLRILAPWRAIRLTYDRERLEIMSPLHEHESDGRFLGRLVYILTEELNLPIKAGGSTTLRRRRKRRGLEPDECFWIASEPQVRGLRNINLRRDPPPDLAIEIDVTSSSLNRMAIYARLGVSEVWRIDGQGLTFHALQADGTYALVPRSPSFPLVRPADLITFMNLRGQLDETSAGQQFRAWVRQQRASSGTPMP